MIELTPSEIQALVQRWAKGETLSAAESEAMERYRRDAREGWQALQQKLDGVTEEEIVEALARDGTITIDARPDLRPPAKLPSRDRTRRPKATRLH